MSFAGWRRLNVATKNGELRPRNDANNHLDPKTTSNTRRFTSAGISYSIRSLYVLAMPAGHPPITAHPAKPFYTLGDAAKSGQLIVQRCNICRRTVNFLATDLIKIVDPKHPTHIPVFPCGQCRSREFVRIKVESARPADIGKIVIRRPGQLIQKWRSVMLGDP